MPNSAVVLRNIAVLDNAAISKVIKDALTEFECNLPGTAFYDPQTDSLFEAYLEVGTAYFVAEFDGCVVGGAGIGKLAGEVHTCELQKLYLNKTYRGLGIANMLMDRCEQFAKEAGYTAIYLETKKELAVAVPFYERRGYKYIDGPLGNTGHFNCEIQMLKPI